MTYERAYRPVLAVIKRAQKMRKLKAYPQFYTLAVTFGLGLFAQEGKHRGSSFGYCTSTTLHLYGAANFERNGGLAWQKRYEEHSQYTPRNR